MDMYPEFPDGRDTILLTEHAKFDPQIVDTNLETPERQQDRRHHDGIAQGAPGQRHRESSGGRVHAGTSSPTSSLPPDYGRGAANYYYSPNRHRVSAAEYGLVDSEEIIQAIYKESSRYPLLLRVRGLEKADSTSSRRLRTRAISTSFRRKCWPDPPRT